MAAGNDVMRGFCLFCCCCFCPFLSTTTTTEEATHNNNNSNSNNNISFTTNINKGAADAASLKLTSLLFYNLQKLTCLARLDLSFGLFFLCCYCLCFCWSFPLEVSSSFSLAAFYQILQCGASGTFSNVLQPWLCSACCPPAVTDCLLKPSSRLFKYLYGSAHTHIHIHAELCCVYANAGTGGRSRLRDNALQRPRNDTNWKWMVSRKGQQGKAASASIRRISHFRNEIAS